MPKSISERKEIFIKQSKAKFGDKFRVTDYQGQNTKVVIICSDHGEFLQSPRCHLDSVYGCPKCAEPFRGNLSKKRSDLDIAVNRLRTLQKKQRKEEDRLKETQLKELRLMVKEREKGIVLDDGRLLLKVVKIAARSRFNNVISRYRPELKGKVKFKFQEVIGCSPESFIAHLNKSMPPGKNWNDYGKRDGIVMDHVNPLKRVRNATLHGLVDLFHFTNVQLLLWRENDRKHDEY